MKNKCYTTDFPTWKQVETRWRTMLKQYKKVVDHNRQSGNDRKTCQYFDELNDILSEKPDVTPQVTFSSSGFGDAKHYGKKKKLNNNNVEAEEGDEEGDSDDDELHEEDDNTVQLKENSKRKRKYVSSSAQATNSILLWLQAYEEKKEEREMERDRRMDEMHADKMNIFKELFTNLVPRASSTFFDFDFRWWEEKGEEALGTRLHFHILLLLLLL